MIDGMGKKKMCLPHMRRLPKDVNDECLVQMHVVGFLAYHGTIKPHVFITYPNVHNDPNLTVTVIHRVLMCWGQPLPLILYAQLDNTARENKNSIVWIFEYVGEPRCVQENKGEFPSSWSHS